MERSMIHTTERSYTIGADGTTKLVTFITYNLYTHKYKNANKFNLDYATAV